MDRAKTHFSKLPIQAQDEEWSVVISAWFGIAQRWKSFYWISLIWRIVFRLKCLPGVLIWERNTGVQHQTKHILKIKAGKKMMTSWTYVWKSGNVLWQQKKLLPYIWQGYSSWWMGIKKMSHIFKVTFKEWRSCL